MQQESFEKRINIKFDGEAAAKIETVKAALSTKNCSLTTQLVIETLLSSMSSDAMISIIAPTVKALDEERTARYAEQRRVGALKIRLRKKLAKLEQLGQDVTEIKRQLQELGE
ncbi:hypothetical protein [Chromobacterium sp. ASV23]|uniref:hypothetical protein n=1 Tax=Chromobacterium sp. ASV23 TaxID=2795110 RepID=UPI0018EA6C06|nr:hypothetical protein [Chromobacterium sp. ASV23]